ncbi:hypothetical protein QBK99_19560 [Corticibacterium sp. UT-5YL-CI-8]|nr:hypothetical protein [Tianweitania sp. UT-5YL-CI-8]
MDPFHRVFILGRYPPHCSCWWVGLDRPLSVMVAPRALTAQIANLIAKPLRKLVKGFEGRRQENGHAKGFAYPLTVGAGIC